MGGSCPPAVPAKATARTVRCGAWQSGVCCLRAGGSLSLRRYCDTRTQVVLLNVHRDDFSHEVVLSVSTRRGRHWQRWGLKHAAGAGKASRTPDWLWGMTGKGTVREALALRIVIGAELKRLSGSRPKRGRGAGAGSFNGYPPHAWSPPVYRGALPPSVQLVERGKPDSLSGAVQGVSPWSRPSASEGNGGAGTGRGRKRRLSCNGADRGTLCPTLQGG
jgi:hypothetical protein